MLYGVSLWSHDNRNIDLGLLENWLNNFFCCQLEPSIFGRLSVKFGVRQGSLLSPVLFSIYLKDISTDRILIPGCCIVLYADILLIAPSFSELQSLSILRT